MIKENSVTVRLIQIPLISCFSGLFAFFRSKDVAYICHPIPAPKTSTFVDFLPVIDIFSSAFGE